MRSKSPFVAALGVAAALFLASCASSVAGHSANPTPSRSARPVPSTSARPSPSGVPTAAPASVSVPFPMTNPPATVAPLTSSTLRAVTAYVQARVTGTAAVAKIGWAQVSVAGAPPKPEWEIAIVGHFYPVVTLACPAGVTPGTKFADKVPSFTTGVVILNPSTLAVALWDPTGTPTSVGISVPCTTGS